jgi:type I restriction enzyme, S subunit
MRAEELLRHYERLADGPDAIGQLRKFILNLAFRGKLVEQNLIDEPASALLNRVAVEAGSSSRIAPPGEVPAMALPPGWCWTTLGAFVAHSESGWSPKTLDQPRSGDAWGVLKVSAVSWNEFRPHENKQVLPGTVPRLQAQVRRGDFLISRANTAELVARAVIVEVDPVHLMMSDKIVRLVLAKSCCPRYVWLVNNFADFARAHYARRASGVSPSMKNVTREAIFELPIPLPPLAGQHRIVAKVDELMALCDRLEAARAEREAARDRLAAASLARLNAPDPETFADDAGFALSALPAITARPDQVKQLRQTILNLAVRGQLVTQSPTDEPSAILLQRIATKKIERRQATGDARIKVEPDPDPADLPMQLPTGWAAQSFENLFLFIDYRGNTPPKTTDGIPLITAKNVRMGHLNREPREFISAATLETWMTRGFPAIGDLFFTTEAPLANVCLNDITEPFALAQRVICLKPYGEINTRFVMMALMSDMMQKLIDGQATGLTAKGIKAAKLKPLPIPIPPLAEQGRIVARVDELMSLCDRLETSLNTATEHRSRFLEALLHDALESGEYANTPARVDEASTA